MKRERSHSHTATQLAAIACLSALAACGGGAGGSGFPAFPPGVAPAPAPATEAAVTPVPPAPPPVTLTGQVLGAGPVAQALVCIDLNDNNECDDGEPKSAPTDAEGRYRLSYTHADAAASKALAAAPLLAVVGTGAAKANSAWADAPYFLKAPAGQPAVLSPLSTLVQRVVLLTGASPAQAQANLSQQLGLDGDLLASYPAGGPVATTAAALLQITQRIATQLADQVGQNASDGSAISAADIGVQTQNALINKLSSLNHMLGQAGVRQACGDVTSSACKSLIELTVKYWAESPNENALTPRTLAAAVGAAHRLALAPTPAADTQPRPSGLLDWFNFADSQNWYHRSLLVSAEQATPIDGLTRFRDQRVSSVNGEVSQWATGGSPQQAGDLHWSGSEWKACTGPSQGTSTLRDAHGVSLSNYCDGRSLSVMRRAELDIGGRKIADVVNGIKALPFSANGPFGNPYSNWGPQGTPEQVNALLGQSVFPEGAKLSHQGVLDLGNAPNYDARASNQIQVFDAAVVAGGDARANAEIACWAANPVSQAANTLEMVIQRFPGKPCIGAPSLLANTQLSSGARNEAWGTSTLSIGTLGSEPLGTAQTATQYYTQNTHVRVSFKGSDSKEVTFWECRQRAINGSTRNCEAVGTGTYSLESLGDARIIRFSAAPGLAAHLSYERVIVERDGKVYYGSRGKEVARQITRINLVAANALFSQLAQKAGANALTPLLP